MEKSVTQEQAFSVFITGASGFVGQRLVQTLGLQTKWRVRASGSRLQAPFALGQHQSWQSINLTDDGEFAGSMRGHDVVVHLAGRAHVIDERAANPLAEYRKLNVAGSMRVANEAVASGVKKFIFLSSIKVNGEATTGVPFTGCDKPAPLDPYGISKAEAEEEIANILQPAGVDFVVLRPPLVYGPGVRANFLSLMKAIERGIPLPLGGVKNKRTMIHIDNLCGAIMAATSNLSIPSGCYTVGDDESLSTAEIMRGLALGMNKDVWIPEVPNFLLKTMMVIPSLSGKIQRLTADLEVDNSDFKRVSGWSPALTASRGLFETGQWYSSQAGQK